MRSSKKVGPSRKDKSMLLQAIKKLEQLKRSPSYWFQKNTKPGKFLLENKRKEEAMTINDDIEQWHKERGIDRMNPVDQFIKLVEEVGELAEGAYKADENKVIDALGDITVAYLGLEKQLARGNTIKANPEKMDLLLLIAELGDIAHKLHAHCYNNETQQPQLQSELIGIRNAVRSLHIHHKLDPEVVLADTLETIKDRKGKVVDARWIEDEDLVTVRTPTNDAVKNPSHYQGKDGLEAIDVIKNFAACPEVEEGFYWGNAIKYLLRYHSKNGVEDLKKARQNLDWLIEERKKYEK